MKSLVFDALDDSAKCLEFAGGCVLGYLGSDGLTRVDAPVQSLGFVQCNLDASDSSRELVAEDFQLVLNSLPVQELPDAVVVQLNLFGSC